MNLAEVSIRHGLTAMPCADGFQLVRSLYTAMSAKSASHWLLEQHSTAKGQPMHLIAAIVAGSIVLLLCVGVAVFVMQKRRYRNRLIPLQELPAS